MIKTLSASDTITTFAQALNRQRGILLNLAFFAYLLLAQPLLVKRLGGILYRDQVDPPVGVLLLAATSIEFVGFIFKTPAVVKRIRRRRTRPVNEWLIFAVWIFHTVVGVSLFLLALKAFGLDVTNENDTLAASVGFWGMLVVVLKELGVLFIWAPLWAGKDDSAAGEPAGSSAREALGDALLFPHASLALTALWDLNARFMPAIDLAAPASIFLYLLSALLFLLFFLPIRGLYLIEEWHTLRSARDALWFSASVALNILAALSLIPRR